MLRCNIKLKMLVISGVKYIFHVAEVEFSFGIFKRYVIRDSKSDA